MAISGFRSILVTLAVIIIVLQLRCILTPSSAVITSSSSVENKRTTPCPTAIVSNKKSQEREDEEKKQQEVTSAPSSIQQKNNEEDVATTPSIPHLKIHVFTYDRLEGLKRLMNSLLRAHYLGHTVTLNVFLDYPKPKKHSADLLHKEGGASDGFGAGVHETRDYLDALKWPFGEYHLHRREINVGLKKTILEAWYPTGNNEVGVFFEDDIEASPFWYQWYAAAAKHYLKYNEEKKEWSGIDDSLLGLSLFRPIHDELSNEACTVDNGFQPYILQQPCSWGAIYFPQPWRRFRKWYQEVGSFQRAELRDKQDASIGPSSNTWDSKSSWKKYLIKYMYQQGWFMIYPNLPNQKVLSTNHLMKGEHPTPPKKLFELPLLLGTRRSQPGDENKEEEDAANYHRLSFNERKSFETFPQLESMLVFNVMFRRKSSLSDLPHYRKKFKERKREAETYMAVAELVGYFLSQYDETVLEGHSTLQRYIIQDCSEKGKNRKLLPQKSGSTSSGGKRASHEIVRQFLYDAAAVDALMGTLARSSGGAKSAIPYQTCTRLLLEQLYGENKNTTSNVQNTIASSVLLKQLLQFKMMKQLQGELVNCSLKNVDVCCAALELLSTLALACCRGSEGRNSSLLDIFLSRFPGNALSLESTCFSSSQISSFAEKHVQLSRTLYLLTILKTVASMKSHTLLRHILSLQHFLTYLVADLKSLWDVTATAASGSSSSAEVMLEHSILFEVLFVLPLQQRRGGAASVDEKGERKNPCSKKVLYQNSVEKLILEVLSFVQSYISTSLQSMQLFSTGEKRIILSAQHDFFRQLLALLSVPSSSSSHHNLSALVMDILQDIIAEVVEPSTDYTLLRSGAEANRSGGTSASSAGASRFEGTGTRMPNYLLFSILRMLKPLQRAADVYLVKSILSLAPDLTRQYFQRVLVHVLEDGKKLVPSSLNVAVTNLMSQALTLPLPIYLTNGAAVLLPSLGGQFLAPTRFYEVTPSVIVEEIAPAWLTEFIYKYLVINNENYLFLCWGIQLTQMMLTRAKYLLQCVARLQKGTGDRHRGSYLEENEVDSDDPWTAFNAECETLILSKLPKWEEFWHRMTQFLVPAMEKHLKEGDPLQAKLDFVLQRMAALITTYTTELNVKTPWVTIFPSLPVFQQPTSTSPSPSFVFLRNISSSTIASICFLLLGNLVSNVKLMRLLHINIEGGSSGGKDHNPQQQSAGPKSVPLIELLYWFRLHHETPTQWEGSLLICHLVLWIIHSISVRFVAEIEEVYLWLSSLSFETIPIFVHLLNAISSQTTSKWAEKITDSFLSASHGMIACAAESFIERQELKISQRSNSNSTTTSHHGHEDSWQTNIRQHLHEFQGIRSTKIIRNWENRKEIYRRWLQFNPCVQEYHLLEKTVAIGKSSQIEEKKNSSFDSSAKTSMISRRRPTSAAILFSLLQSNQLIIGSVLNVQQGAHNPTREDGPASWDLSSQHPEWLNALQSQKLKTCIKVLLQPYLFEEEEEQKSTNYNATSPFPWLACSSVTWHINNLLYQRLLCLIHLLAQEGGEEKQELKQKFRYLFLFCEQFLTSCIGKSKASPFSSFWSSLAEDVSLTIGFLLYLCTAFVMFSQSLGKGEKEAGPDEEDDDDDDDEKVLSEKNISDFLFQLYGGTAALSDRCLFAAIQETVVPWFATTRGGEKKAGGEKGAEMQTKNEDSDEEEDESVVSDQQDMEDDEGTVESDTEETTTTKKPVVEEKEESITRENIKIKKKSPSEMFKAPAMMSLWFARRFRIGFSDVDEAHPSSDVPEVDSLSNLVMGWNLDTSVDAALHMPLNLRFARVSTAQESRSEGEQNTVSILSNKALGNISFSIPEVSINTEAEGEGEGEEGKKNTTCFLPTHSQHSVTQHDGTLDPRYFLPLIYVNCALRKQKAAGVPTSLLLRCLPYLVRSLSCTDVYLRYLASTSLALIHVQLPAIQRGVVNSVRLVMASAANSRSEKGGSNPLGNRLSASHSAFFALALVIAPHTSHPLHKLISTTLHGSSLAHCFPLHSLFACNPFEEWSFSLTGTTTHEEGKGRHHAKAAPVLSLLSLAKEDMKLLGKHTFSSQKDASPFLLYILKQFQHSCLDRSDVRFLHHHQVLSSLLQSVIMCRHSRPLWPALVQSLLTFVDASMQLMHHQQQSVVDTLSRKSTSSPASYRAMSDIGKLIYLDYQLPTWVLHLCSQLLMEWVPDVHALPFLSERFDDLSNVLTILLSNAAVLMSSTSMNSSSPFIIIGSSDFAAWIESWINVLLQLKERKLTAPQRLLSFFHILYLCIVMEEQEVERSKRVYQESGLRASSSSWLKPILTSYFSFLQDSVEFMQKNLYASIAELERNGRMLSFLVDFEMEMRKVKEYLLF